MFALFIAIQLLFFSPSGISAEPFHPSPSATTIKTMKHLPSSTPADDAVKQLQLIITELTASLRYILEPVLKNK